MLNLILGWKKKVAVKYECVYFRVDIGDHIGLGHLSRCKSLASAFLKNGIQAIFLTRKHFRFSVEFFLPFKVVVIGGGIQSDLLPVNSLQWLGVSEEIDAQETIQYLSKNSILIVDHYSITSKWHSFVQPFVLKIIAIDDLINRELSVDFVIDHNPTGIEAKYRSININSRGIYLIGPQYAMLSPPLIDARRTYQLTQEANGKALIYLGSIPMALVDKMLGFVLNNAGEMRLKEVTVIGASEKICINLPRTNVKINLMKGHQDLIGLYAKHEYVFGSCGVAQLERMFLGIKSITTVVVDNQNDFGKILMMNKYSIHLGDLREGSFYQTAANNLKKLSADEPNWSPKIIAGKEMIASDGCDQIIKIIDENMG